MHCVYMFSRPGPCSELQLSKLQLRGNRKSQKHFCVVHFDTNNPTWLVPCSIVLRHIVLQSKAVLFCIVLYHVVVYHIVLYCIVYRIVMYCAAVIL